MLGHLQQHFGFPVVTRNEDGMDSVFTAFFNRKYSGEASLARFNKAWW